MEEVIIIDSVRDYNVLNNLETLHPLVSIIDFSKANARDSVAPRRVRMHYGVYCIFLKDVVCGDLKYGKNNYDYQEGTLVFIAPGQVMHIDYNVPNYQPKGYALVFHADLIRGTSLGKNIETYNFFSYDTCEALHVSEKERQIVMDCFYKIDYELKQSIDKHSKMLITSNIELFLNYCTRFYDRQFITRDHVNKGVLEKFERLLGDYFSSDRPQNIGLPSVAYFARELHLSANYFGDLIKKETGTSAQEYIQSKVISLSKERIFDIDRSISEIAYELGFKYPQHFTRLFKQKVGMSPVEYRNLN